MNYPRASVLLQPVDASHKKPNLIEDDECSLDDIFKDDSDSGKDIGANDTLRLQKSLSRWSSISEDDSTVERKGRRIVGGRNRTTSEERSVDFSIELSIEEVLEVDEVSLEQKDSESEEGNSTGRGVARWYSMSSTESNQESKISSIIDGKPYSSTEDLVEISDEEEDDDSPLQTPKKCRVSPRKVKSTSDWLDVPNLDQKRGVRRGVSDLGHCDLSKSRSLSNRAGLQTQNNLNDVPSRGLAKRGESVRRLNLEPIVAVPQKKYRSPQKQRRSLAKRGQSVRNLIAVDPETPQDMRKAMASRGLSVRRLNSDDSLPILGSVKRSNSGDSGAFTRKIERKPVSDSPQGPKPPRALPKYIPDPKKNSPATSYQGSPGRVVGRKSSPKGSSPLPQSGGRTRCISNESFSTSASMIPSLEPLEEDKELNVQHDNLIKSPMLRLKTGSKFQLSIPVPKIDCDDDESMDIEQAMNAPPLTRKASRSPSVSPIRSPKRIIVPAVDQVSPPHVETSFTKRSEKAQSSDLEWVPPGAPVLSKLPEIEEVQTVAETEEEHLLLTPRRSNQKSFRKMISSSFLRRKHGGESEFAQDHSEYNNSICKQGVHDHFKVNNNKGSLSPLRLFSKSLSCRNPELQVANCYGQADSRFGTSITAYSDDSTSWHVSNGTPKYKKPSEIQLDGSMSADPSKSAITDISLPAISLEQAYRNCRSRSPKQVGLEKLNSMSVMTGLRKEITVSPMMTGRSLSTAQMESSPMESKGNLSRKMSFGRRSTRSINTCNAVSEDLYNPTKTSNTPPRGVSPVRWHSQQSESTIGAKAGERQGVLARWSSSLSHIRLLTDDEEPTEIEEEESYEADKKEAPRQSLVARAIQPPVLRRVQSDALLQQNTTNTSVLVQKQQERKNLLARMRNTRRASGDEKTAEMMSIDEYTPKQKNHEFIIEPDSPLRSQADIPSAVFLDPEHAIEVSSTVTFACPDEKEDSEYTVQCAHERPKKPSKKQAPKQVKKQYQEPKKKATENQKEENGEVSLDELFQSYTSFSYTENDDFIEEVEPIRETPAVPFEFSDDEESFFGTGKQQRARTPLSRVRQLQANNMKYRSRLIIDLDSDDDESLGFDIVDDTTIGNNDVYLSDDGRNTISDDSYDIEVVKRLERSKKTHQKKTSKPTKRGGKRRAKAPHCLIEV